jgi:hypothetical protein
MVKDKEGIKNPKSSLKMLISPNNYQFSSKFWINPEPGTLNLLTQTDRMSNLWVIPRSIKVYVHFYLMNNEVCI